MEENRDVIVIGASAGGVAAVQQLVAGLPADLPAAVFVVVHRGAAPPNLLAEILSAAGPLPATAAGEGERFAPGRVYVPPADHHLIVGPDHVHVRRGPRENRARPAIDVLFRSAAVSCSSRVVGVLLTGMLDDGTAGLLAIRRCEGLALVQDPEDALFPDMPRSAIEKGAADEVAALDRLAGLISRRAREPRPAQVEAPKLMRMETLIAAQELHVDPDRNPLGTLSPLTCPDCHGALREIREGRVLRYRCHTGHAFSAEALQDAQGEEWERALYRGLRVQEEQLALVRHLAEEVREGASPASLRDWEERARSYQEGAEIMRRLIENGRARRGNGSVGG